MTRFAGVIIGGPLAGQKYRSEHNMFQAAENPNEPLPFLGYEEAASTVSIKRVTYVYAQWYRVNGGYGAWVVNGDEKRFDWPKILIETYVAATRMIDVLDGISNRADLREATNELRKALAKSE